MKPQSLEEHFESIQDFRRAEGRRYPLSKLLIIIVMAMMSGASGYREIARFMRVNQRELIDHLAWPRPQTPSYETLRTILSNIDFNFLNQLFDQWMRQVQTTSQADWIAIDGKAIRSTVTDYSTASQNFVSMVSAFNQRTGLVISQEAFENKKSDEVSVVITLIQKLNQQGLVFSLDALHCKKNS